MAKKKKDEAEIETAHIPDGKLVDYREALEYVYRFTTDRKIRNFAGKTLGLDVEAEASSNAERKE